MWSFLYELELKKWRRDLFLKPWRHYMRGLRGFDVLGWVCIEGRKPIDAIYGMRNYQCFAQGRVLYDIEKSKDRLCGAMTRSF